MLNLLHDPWLPVIRRQSGRCLIRPAQIASRHTGDPVIAIDWPRPDFCIATLEFLTGLLVTTFPPEDDDAWLGFWREPPDTDQLDKAFAPFAHAFALDGEGSRFLQDLEDLQSSAEPIERLLIEAPGDSTNSKNTDLLVHRNRVANLSRASAAMALYTFQSWAPAGGAGNRTGLRGGGPLVTMVLPGAAPTVWQTVWANVPQGGKPPMPADFHHVFPWLAPTVISDSAITVTPQNAHPLQCWWGMPRRIRLDFITSERPEVCDLTGETDTVQVGSWRQRPRGANYAFWGGQHPLTPHYQQKVSTEILAVHPQPGGIGYQHWLGLVMKSKDGLRKPAYAVTTWLGGRGLTVGVRGVRLIAAGYDMDNMKARGFVESEMPLPSAANQAAQKDLDDLAERLVASADQVASLVRRAVRNALFNAGATVKLDIGLLNTTRERLWDQTAVHFFTMLNTVAKGTTVDTDVQRTGWRRHLHDVALALFDEAAPLSADAGWTAAARISKARRILRFTLTGYGAEGGQLYTTLALPAPQPSAPKTKGKPA